MDAAEPPPFYRSPSKAPSFLKSLKSILSDPAAVIPAAIFEEWAVKLPGPGFPLVVAYPEDVRDVLIDKDGAFGRDRQLRRLMRRALGRGPCRFRRRGVGESASSGDTCLPTSSR